MDQTNDLASYLARLERRIAELERRPETREIRTLRLTDTSDVTAAGGGGLIVGGPHGSASSLHIDSNEIQAFNSAGTPGPLSLNVEGGPVQIFDLGMTDISASAPTAASGWSISAYHALRSAGGAGPFLQVRVAVTRTGGSISVPTNGDLGNMTIATLHAAARGSIASAASLSTAGTGRVAAGYVVPSTGQVVLAAVAGSSAINTGSSIELAGLVIV